MAKRKKKKNKKKLCQWCGERHKRYGGKSTTHRMLCGGRIRRKTEIKYPNMED